jgi:hypothetical protein
MGRKYKTIFLKKINLYYNYKKYKYNIDYMYFEIFLNSIIDNLFFINKDNFLFRIAIKSIHPKISKSIIFISYYFGFIVSFYFNFFTGYMINILSLKFNKKNIKNIDSAIDFANFLYHYQLIIIFLINLLAQNNIFFSIFSIFLGYSFAILKIFHNNSLSKKIQIFFYIFIIIFCAKILNIYLFIN